MIKKVLFLTFSSFFVLAGCNQNISGVGSDKPFACSHPGYEKVENGMNKEEVRNLLGSASKEVKKVKDISFEERDKEMEKYANTPSLQIPMDIIDQGLFVGRNEMDEYWVYTLDPNAWEGNLEVYFNKEKEVIGKNCGLG